MSDAASSKPGDMPLADALSILRRARGDGDVVLTSMGTAREWMKLGDPHPRDFIHVPSSMGQTPAWGLGLALAQPARRIVACCGDGSLLMNFGSLVTIASAAPANFALLLFDNGVYEVTGGQPTPASALGPAARFDWESVAKGCGLTAVREFHRLDDWERGVAWVFSATGPLLGILRVAPIPGARGPRSPGPGAERIAMLRASLQAPACG